VYGFNRFLLAFQVKLQFYIMCLAPCDHVASVTLFKGMRTCCLGGFNRRFQQRFCF
jgi:hypothetical protein